MEADGSALYTIQALWTQARENLAVTNIVLNNGAYAILRLEMMRAGRFLNVDVIMAGILTIGILGVLTDLAFRGVAHVALPWHRTRRG